MLPANNEVATAELIKIPRQRSFALNSFNIQLCIGPIIKHAGMVNIICIIIKSKSKIPMGRRTKESKKLPKSMTILTPIKLAKYPEKTRNPP